MISTNRVLAVGAHTDDIELGCGATLSWLIDRGAEVATIAFSRAELSRPEGTPVDILEQEYRTAMRLLGVRDTNVHCGELPVRTMHNYRQQVLDRLIQLRREFNPDLILTMGGADTHQDHEVVHRESVRAFRNRTLFAYHSPWNERVLRTNFFVAVRESDVEMKIRLLGAYESQAALNRPYVQPERIRSTLEFYGQQVGVPLAEAFEVLSAVSGE